MGTHNMVLAGVVVCSVVCPLHMQVVQRLTLVSCTFLMENYFPSSADSIRACCQLIAKEWPYNTGKLPLGGLQRKCGEVTDSFDMTSAVYSGCKATN